MSACTDFPEKIFPEISRTRKNIFRIFCEPPKFFRIILKIRKRKKSKRFSHELFSQRFRAAPAFCKRVDLPHPSARVRCRAACQWQFSQNCIRIGSLVGRQKRSSCGRCGYTKDRSVKDVDSDIVPGVTSLNADSVHRTRVYERTNIFLALFYVGAGSILNEPGG